MAFSTNPIFAPENLLKMSAAMFAAPTFAQGLGGATDALSTSITAQKEKQKEADLRNKTAEMLALNAPDIAENVRLGAMSATDGLRLYYQQKKDAADAAKPKYLTEGGKIIKLDEAAGKTEVIADYSTPKTTAEYQDFQLEKNDPEYAAAKKAEREAKNAPSPQDQFKNEVEVMKAYRADPVVKDFGTIKSSYEKMRNAASLGTGQGDIAIIYSYMKMLDPGSVVREGEYATAQNASGLPQGIIAKYNSLLNGDKLTPEMRAQFVTAAESQFKQAASSLAEVNARYEGLANQYAVPTERFVEKPKEYPALDLAPGQKIETTVNGKKATIERVPE